MMKTAIEIEKLVQWAMRDELPKGQAVAASAWDIITQYAALGVRVDTSGPKDGYGFTPGAPHADALIVAEVVRNLATDWKFATTFDAREALGEFAPIAGDAVPALMMSRVDPRSLVISMAMQGKRPPWQFEAPTPQRMMSQFLDAQGAVRERPLVHGTDAEGQTVAMLPNRGRKAQREGAFDYAMSPRSPLDWHSPSPLQVGECRAEYIAWHAALTFLRAALNGRLAEFEVLPTPLAARPWITGQTPASRVLAGLDLVGDMRAGLPIEPKRKAPLRPRSRIADKGRSIIVEINVQDNALAVA